MQFGTQVPDLFSPLHSAGLVLPLPARNARGGRQIRYLDAWASCLQEAVANAQLPVVEWLMTLRCRGYSDDAPVDCDALIDIYAALCNRPGLKWNSWPWYWICRQNSAPKRLWMAQDLLFWRRTERVRSWLCEALLGMDFLGAPSQPHLLLPPLWQ